MKMLKPRFTQILAASVVGAALAAPMTASAGPIPKGIAALKGTIALPILTPGEIIAGKAAALGSSFTGAAVSELETVPGGYRIRYERCDIYYSSTTGAREVHGGIRLKYNLLGGPWGDLGFPTTDELTARDGRGRYSEFSGQASIYWSPETGPMVVRGGIRSLWAGQDAERGPLGYPTRDEQTLGPGQAFSDFQNGVLYWEENAQRAAETAGLPGYRTLRAFRNFLKPYFDYQGLRIDGVSITDVSNTGYDLWHSRNRLVTFHIDGKIVKNNWPDGNFTMDLRVLFFAHKAPEGVTTLRMALDRWEIRTSGDYANLTSAFSILQYAAGDDGLSRLVRALYRALDTPAKLIDLEIPAATPVLSFKVLADGGITVYLKPGGFAPLAQLAIQRELDDAAK